MLSDSFVWPHGLLPARRLCPWDLPGKDTVVGCHFLLQKIFPTQGLIPCLQHWQAGTLPLSHLGSPLTEYGGYILLVNNQQHQPKTVCTEISSIAPKLVRLSSSLVSSYNLYRVGKVLIFLSSCRHIILDEWVSVISIILLEMTYWKLNGFSSGWT